MDRKTALEQANNLLKKAGYTLAGMPRSEESWKQASFERRMIKTPTGGKQPRPGLILK